VHEKGGAMIPGAVSKGASQSDLEKLVKTHVGGGGGSSSGGGAAAEGGSGAAAAGGGEEAHPALTESSSVKEIKTALLKKKEVPAGDVSRCIEKSELIALAKQWGLMQ